jgi:hypothetical protein
MPNVVLDKVRNFIKVGVLPHTAADTVWQLSAPGDATRLPPVPFNMVVYNDTDYPDAADDPDREIYRITGVDVGTGALTGLRAQEGTAVSAKNRPQKRYLMRLTPTAKLVEDIQSHIDDDSRHKKLNFHESQSAVRWAWFLIE